MTLSIIILNLLGTSTYLKQKKRITMATLTKKDLLKAIEDIPMDAELMFSIYYSYGTDDYDIDSVSYISDINKIRLC